MASARVSTRSSSAKKTFNPRDLKARARSFVFTWNNYTPESLKVVEEFHLHCQGELVWLYSAFEEGKDGTPHLQGTLTFKSNSYRSLKSIVNKLIVSKPVYRVNPDTNEVMKDDNGKKIIEVHGNNADVQLGRPDKFGGSDYGRLRYCRKGGMDSDLYHSMLKAKENPESHETFGPPNVHYIYGKEHLPLTPPAKNAKGNISNRGHRTDIDEAKELIRYLWYLRLPVEHQVECPSFYKGKVEPLVKDIDPVELDIQRILFDVLPSHLQVPQMKKHLDDCMGVYRVDTVRLRHPVVPHPVEKEWYTYLDDLISEVPTFADRRIHIIVDHAGNAAKSTYCRQLLAKKPRRTVVLTPSKDADVAYVLKENLLSKTPSVVCYDMPRSKANGDQDKDYSSYFFLESLKNGLVMSPKYESSICEIEPVHVLMFRNSMPKFSELSLDRICVYEFVLPTDPEYKLDKHGHQMFVVRDAEWVKGRAQLELERSRGTGKGSSAHGELLQLMGKNLDTLTSIAKSSKEQDRNLLNYHSGPPNKTNTPFHQQVVADAIEAYNGQILKGTSLKLRGVKVTPGKLKGYESTESRNRKKRKVVEKAPLNPEFLRTFIDPPPSPRLARPLCVNIVAGDPSGLQAHQRLKQRCVGVTEPGSPGNKEN